MRAVVVTRPGGPEVLEITDRPEPEPGPGRVLVEVAATAVNRADILQRSGFYPAPPGAPRDILGLEMAGTVAALGEGVETHSVGDRVMSILAGGGYAEKAVVDHRHLMPVPGDLSLVEAAGIPEVFLTAYDAMVLQCGLRSGEWVLIHAAASGVGTAAIQIAHAVGARTVGTASGHKVPRARRVGLDVGVDRRKEDFVQVVRRITDERGVDVILDLVGASNWERNLEALAVTGRIVIVGTVGGSTVERMSMRTLMGKRLTVRGTVLRPRSDDEKAHLTRSFTQRMLPGFETGRLRPIIDRVLPIEEVAAAHSAVEGNETIGKVVLRMRD